MLTHRFSSVFCVQAAVAAALVISGCVVLSDPTGSAGSATSAAGGGSASSSSSSSSSSTSTSTSSSASGTGGGMCVGETGVGAVADCDKLVISPQMGTPGNCGPNNADPAYGYSLCTRGYTIFTNGAADDLDACLAGIAVQDSCDANPPTDCITKMYKDVCTDAVIASTCASIGTQCGNDPFDVTKCSGDLNPFSNPGLKELEDCLNTALGVPGALCQKSYDDCYNQVLTF